MASNRAASFNDVSKPKRISKRLTLDEKMEILNMMEEGKTIVEWIKAPFFV